MLKEGCGFRFTAVRGGRLCPAALAAKRQGRLRHNRFGHLTRHVAFLADALDLTIEQEMRAEAQYLQRHGAARARLKNIVEGPDPTPDRIMRSVRESRGAISGKLRAEYPILERPEIAEDVVRAIREEFPWAAG